MEDLWFWILMACVSVFLIGKAFHNKWKYGTFVHPFHHSDYYEPEKDPLKTDYFERVDERVREREEARERRRAEKIARKQRDEGS